MKISDLAYKIGNKAEQAFNKAAEATVEAYYKVSGTDKLEEKGLDGDRTEELSVGTAGAAAFPAFIAGTIASAPVLGPFCVIGGAFAAAVSAAVAVTGVQRVEAEYIVGKDDHEKKKAQHPSVG